MELLALLTLALLVALWAYYERREAYIKGLVEGWRRGYNDAMRWCYLTSQLLEALSQLPWQDHRSVEDSYTRDRQGFVERGGSR